MIEIVKEIEKSPTERIRVSVNEYEGHEYIDCRVWFKNEERSWIPTKKGITLNYSNIYEAIDGLKKAAQQLKR